jgi:hypothetical protein
MYGKQPRRSIDITRNDLELIYCALEVLRPDDPNNADRAQALSDWFYAAAVEVVQDKFRIDLCYQ